MPAYFEFEALRAQAVAARTFALRCHQDLGKHPGGAVCTDPACCQAYLSREHYLAQGGSPDDADKIRRAVESTTGQIVTYEGELIEAPYFSCSGGRTEDAAAVWGNEVPYLLSLASPGEEEAAVFKTTVTFTQEEFCALLGRSIPGPPYSWFGYPTYTEGGGVASITIAGQSYTGVALRKLLDLNSTAFSIRTSGNLISVTTSGKGHRVGMSQYGADAMALKGHTYDTILRYYYPGTRIDKMDTLG
jgi:stage II sporulation protein D